MWTIVGERNAVEKGDVGYKDRHLRPVFGGGWLRRVVNAAREMRVSQGGCDLVARGAPSRLSVLRHGLACEVSRSPSLWFRLVGYHD